MQISILYNLHYEKHNNKFNNSVICDTDLSENQSREISFPHTPGSVLCLYNKDLSQFTSLNDLCNISEAETQTERRMISEYKHGTQTTDLLSPCYISGLRR